MEVETLNAKNIGNHIIFLRKQRRWSQKELADELGVSGKTVSKWETGGGLPDIEFLPKIAEVFEVSVDYIIDSNPSDNFTEYETLLELYSRSHFHKNKISDTVVELEKNFEDNSTIGEKLFEEFNVKKGLRDLNGVGVRAGLTKISEIVSKKIVNGESLPTEGELYYRGYNVKELVSDTDKDNPFGFEETAYLLLCGQLPTKSELEIFKRELISQRDLPQHFCRDVIMKAPGEDIMNSISKSVLTLASYDTAANDISLPNVMRQSVKLVACFPLLAIYGYQAYIYYKKNQSLVLHNPIAEYSTAENILHLLRPNGKFSKTESHILDIALILHAEHGGGNNSSFTTNVVTSSGTDTYSAITAALCSLKGPKHGGANLKVVQMFADLKKNVSDITDLAKVTEYLEAVLDGKAFDGKGLIYGMGHAVYSLSDPRAEVFKGYLHELAEEKHLQSDYNLYCNVAEIATELIAKKRHIYKGVSANIDFYSGLAYKILGLPDELFTPIFAVARVVGWSAHRLEELLNAGKIIRPEYKSVAERREYVAKTFRK